MNRITPEESLFYPISMRGTCPDLKEVKVYTDRNKFEIDALHSFDIEHEGITSMSYFLGSILSSCILSAIKYLSEHDIELDEIEGTIEAVLTNPLRMIPVQGYDDPSNIEDIKIKLYYYADHDEEEVQALIRESQDLNPIVRLIKQASDVSIEIEMVI